MTSDGDALFRAVCEDPADDTPRLAYADWLDENGRAERAEFVRLQCEAADVCPGYPTPAARRTRASVLLREFGDRWWAELPAAPGLEWGSLFVRGFVDVAWLRSVDDLPAVLDAVFAAAPLGRLEVYSLRPRQLRVLLAYPLLGRLATLRLPRDQAGPVRQRAEARARFPRTRIVF